MQGVILAAGKGKRLQPFTLTRSKGMAPIIGKPMCARVVDSLIAAGINDFVMVISPDDAEIKEYFINTYSASNSLTFNFVVQPERLGMAHALNCTKDFVHDMFILSAADSLVSSHTISDLIATYTKKQANIVLALLPVTPDKVSKTGIVQLDKENNVIKIVEKPKLEEAPSNISSLPLYVFKPLIFDYLPKVPLSVRGEYELQDAIQMIINDLGNVSGVMADYRLDLTTPDDLLTINLKFLAQMKDSVISSPIPASCKLVNPVFISENVTIGDGCTLGPNVFLEKDTLLGDGVVIKNSVVLKGSKVESGRVLDNEILM